MQHLALTGSPLAPADVDIIVGAHFPELRTLELERCGLRAPEARVLARGAWPNLERIVLKHNSIGPNLDDLAEVCAGVTHLDLEDTGLERIEDLLAACKSIETLVIGANPIGHGQTIQSATLQTLDMQFVDEVRLGTLPNIRTIIMGELDGCRSLRDCRRGLTRRRMHCRRHAV